MGTWKDYSMSVDREAPRGSDSPVIQIWVRLYRDVHVPQSQVHYCLSTARPGYQVEHHHLPTRHNSTYMKHINLWTIKDSFFSEYLITYT